MDNGQQALLKGYELKDQIGTGGFGAVYRAYQPAVAREVAIKIILPKHANQPDFIRRFEVEAQLIARLESPHIVPLYDFWRDPEGAYLVMGWLRGSLAASLKNGPWSAEATARLLDQVALALTVAHRAGVIHRDLKPDNILLDEDDNAYLADFGIAKDLNLATLSQEGLAIGSPAYMSPEQIKGETVSPQTDQYSLALVVYEMLVNQKPFGAGGTMDELISQQLYTPLRPVHEQRTGLPAALSEVLATATAKKPEDRYANVLRFAQAFRAALPARSEGQPLTQALTGRELDILRHMVEGLSNGEIAQALHLTLETVRWYVKQIYAKLDVHSRRQAVERARRLNLLEPFDAPPAEDVTPTVHSLALPIVEAVNPYKGLRAFQEADVEDFFGRSALVEHLVTRLDVNWEQGRFLLVVGPSGSGKSSVVCAGLLPALRHGAAVSSERWFITDMLPGTHPLEELEAALLRVAVTPTPGVLACPPTRLGPFSQVRR
jgi:serine/threonine protein kinase